jgi:hypothetical protein
MTADQQTIRSPKGIRNDATAALKAGRLHPDRWAEVDDLLLDERPDQAAELLTQHIAPEPVYPAVPSCEG